MNVPKPVRHPRPSSIPLCAGDLREVTFTIFRLHFRDILACPFVRNMACVTASLIFI